MSLVKLLRLTLAVSSSGPVTGTRCLHTTSSRHRHYLNADAQTLKHAISPDTAQSRTVLVDFYADWCGPCKTLSPILHNLTNDESVRTGSDRALDLVTVDTDVEFDLAQEYNVRALPTVIAFKDGKLVDKFVGALNEAGVRHFLQKL